MLASRHDPIVLLVVTNPKEAAPPLLDRMPSYVKASMGVNAEDFAGVVENAEVIFTWGAKREAMEKLLTQARS